MFGAIKKTFFFSFLLFLTLGQFNFALAHSQTGEVPNESNNKIEVTFFYSQTCPHCAKEEVFLADLEKKYPEIDLKKYEVVFHPENQPILADFYEKYKIKEGERGRVPLTFVADKYFIGYNEVIGQDIENKIKEILGRGEQSPSVINIPFLGPVDLSKMSLPVLTIVLGTLDGFNPCAMWILVVLVSLLLPLRSRRKIALIGGTFIFAEGLLYFIFMAAWLNVFMALKYVSLLRIGIGIFGIVFGALRIRDFLTWKPGTCKVVDDNSQKKLMGRINNLLKPSAVPVTIFGVIILAFGVNVIEFFCSAGFPMIYTRILALQHVSQLQYYLYLISYNFFYMIDDFLVFGFAFFTLSRFNFSDKYNYYSTIVAGLLIFILGLLLIFKPEFLMFSM